MIRSIGSKDTKSIWREQIVEGVDRAVQRATLLKLGLISKASALRSRTASLVLLLPRRLEQCVGLGRGQRLDGQFGFAAVRA